MKSLNDDTVYLWATRISLWSSIWGNCLFLVSPSFGFPNAVNYIIECLYDLVWTFPITSSPKGSPSSWLQTSYWFFMLLLVLSILLRNHLWISSIFLRRLETTFPLVSNRISCRMEVSTLDRIERLQDCVR